MYCTNKHCTCIVLHRIRSSADCTRAFEMNKNYIRVFEYRDTNIHVYFVSQTDADLENYTLI